MPVRCYARPPALGRARCSSRPLARSAGDVLLVDPALRPHHDLRRRSPRLVEGAADGAARARGCAPGDRVARAGPQRAGGRRRASGPAPGRGLVHVGLPVDAPPARLRELLELTGAALLLVQPELRPVAEPAAGPVPVADAAEVLLGARDRLAHGRSRCPTRTRPTRSSRRAARPAGPRRCGSPGG